MGMFDQDDEWFRQPIFKGEVYGEWDTEELGKILDELNIEDKETNDDY